MREVPDSSSALFDDVTSKTRYDPNLDGPLTVVLLMRSEENRSLLETYLEPKYAVETGTTPDVLDAGTDLCFIDERSFRHHAESLHRWKERGPPVFTPIVLLCRNARRVREDPAVWNVVDDVFSIPMRKAAVTSRVESLLRHRARSRELDVHRRQLAAKNDHLETFASDIAHDLRNPLEIADGYVDQVRKEYDGDHLDEIDLALERMESIVEETLQLARDGVLIDDPKPVDLYDPATDAWERCPTESATLQVSDELGTVHGDDERLQTAFENFYRNAIDHGEADVTVTIGVHESGFFVEDDGPGIPDPKQSEVFTLGYTTSDDGTGRGLGIVKRIIEAHGWDVTVCNGTSGGARFEISTTGEGRSPRGDAAARRDRRDIRRS